MVGKKALFFGLICALLCTINLECAPEKGLQSVNVVWAFASDEHHDDALAQMPEQFFLTHLTYAADCAFERDELCYILGFDAPAHVTREQLHRGIQRLGYKEKFDYITLYATQTPQGWSLHLVFSSRWTLSKIRCKGSLLGKERYRHQYRIESGERFDPIKHHDSLVAIEDELHAQGYLDPDVVDFLAHDNRHKTVSVVLALDPGKQYTIRSFDVVCDEQQSPKHNALALKMKHVFTRELYGELYSKGVVQQTERHLEELCAQEGFLQATVTHTYTADHTQRTVQVVFSVTLGERRLFSFFGNHFFSEKQLLNRLLLFGKSVLMIPPSLLAQELTDLYKSKGFWNVAVTWQEEEDRCLFCIVEGARARIVDVSFEGVTYFSSEQLKKICSELTHTTFFDQRLARQCRDEILQAYVRAGFWDCSVKRSDAHVLRDNSYVYHFVIHEGDQRLLKSVRISSPEAGVAQACETVLEQAPFVAYKNLKKPIPFDMYLVQEQRRALLASLQKMGYLQATIKPDLRHDNAGNIDLVWVIEHATHITFGSTILAGESRLPAALIRRELLYEQGQVWDQKKLDRSVARLKSLGIFDKVTLQPVVAQQGGARRDSAHDIVLTCVDDDPFEVRLRAGMECVGQYFEFHDIGVCGGGSLVWKNPFNRADRIELAIDIAPHEDYGQLSYITPRFFNWPVTTTTSVYVSRFDQPLVNCFRERLYRLEQDGGSLELEYADNGDKFGCCFGFEAMKVYDISRKLADLIDFAPRLVGQRIPYFYAEPVLVKSYVDDLVNPTSGTIVTVTGKAMASLSHKASGFFKILLEESIFVPLNTTATWIGAVHLRAGHIFYSDFETIMPPERFYLGGAYSLRGYDADMAPPVDIAKSFINGRACCLLPIGGKTVLSGMFEVRFPLYGALGGVFFNDCGILVRKEWKDDNFVGATGFGLRYATPVGPLRFDIAWKWRRQKGEEHRFAWFLTLGQAF